MIARCGAAGGFGEMGCGLEVSEDFFEGGVGAGIFSDGGGGAPKPTAGEASSPDPCNGLNFS